MKPRRPEKTFEKVQERGSLNRERTNRTANLRDKQKKKVLTKIKKKLQGLKLRHAKRTDKRGEKCR